MRTRARTLNVGVKDSLFDPDRPSDRVVQIRETPSERPLYRVFLYLDGVDLPFVSRVTYRLHDTFSPNTRTLERQPSNPLCKIDIWTWGVFTVHAVIEDKQGRTVKVTHPLEYARLLREQNLQFRSS